MNLRKRLTSLIARTYVWKIICVEDSKELITCTCSIPQMLISIVLCILYVAQAVTARVGVQISIEVNSLVYLIKLALLLGIIANNNCNTFFSEFA